MATPAWVRRDLKTLRALRDANDAVLQTSTDTNERRHAAVCAALCRLLIAALLDHVEEHGPQLALVAAWIDALPQLISELRTTRMLKPERADAFVAAVTAQLANIEAVTTIPGHAVVLLPPEPGGRRRLGPFEDLARRLRHKGAIEALQRHLPTFEPVSPLVDALMDEAVEEARRTALDALPDGANRIAREAVLSWAADAVAGLATARPWLEGVEDPYLHPGASILFVRVRTRMGAGRALAALDQLRASDLGTASMEALRTEVQNAVEQDHLARAIEVLTAHAPALECARALLWADNLDLNAVGRAVAGVVGRQLPSPETVQQLDRLRRVAALVGDPLAEALVAQAAVEGDVAEQDLAKVESARIRVPINLRRLPSGSQAAAVLTRRAAIVE